MRRSSTTSDVERSRSTYSTSMGPLKSPNAETMRAKVRNISHLLKQVEAY